MPRPTPTKDVLQEVTNAKTPTHFARRKVGFPHTGHPALSSVLRTVFNGPISVGGFAVRWIHRRYPVLAPRGHGPHISLS